MKSILIVDDDVLFIELLRETLVTASYRVFCAKDGVEALELLQKEGAMMVVTDLQMPRMDGLTLTRRIRADVRLRHAPILMLSIRDAVEETVTGYEYGVDDYLAKPFDPPMLLTKLSALGRRTPPPWRHPGSE